MNKFISVRAVLSHLLWSTTVEVSKESSVPVVLSELVQGMSLDNLLVHESDITLQRIVGEGNIANIHFCCVLILN